MNANYSEALEQQVALHAYVCSDLAHQRELNDIQRYRDETGREPPLNEPDSPGVMLGLTRMTLERAAPFYWAAQLNPLLQHGALSFPSNWVLRPDDLPCPSGFVWFANPLPLPTRAKIREFGWMETLQALGWTQHSDSTDLLVSAVLTSSRRTGGEPWYWWTWKFGESLEATCNQLQPLPGKPRVAATIFYFATVLAFMQQRILQVQHQLAERHARKRVEQANWEQEPIIRVVELRRRETLVTHTVQPTAREWSCQWVVRGHWRQQPYPKVGAVRPKWITPYVKGPDDKPLKPPRATVFAVVR